MLDQTYGWMPRINYPGYQYFQRFSEPYDEVMFETSWKGGSEKELENLNDSSVIIRNWAEKLLGKKFETLTELACHLIDKMYVDDQSYAAFNLKKSTTSDWVPLKPKVSPPNLASELSECSKLLENNLKVSEHNPNDSENINNNSEATLVPNQSSFLSSCTKVRFSVLQCLVIKHI